MRNTYDFKLTKGATVLHLAGERDEQGVPMLRLGSREDEVAKAGQAGTIRIESLHNGAGQKVLLDPFRYDESVGWDLTERGRAKLLGSDTAYALEAPNTYTNLGRAALVADNSDAFIFVLPNQILDGDPTVGLPTARRSPNGTGIFTGSYAAFGDRIFFGAQAAAGAAQPTSDQYAVRRSLLDTYGLSGAGTSDKIASFFASTGTRLFRVREDGATATAYASHTQQTGSDTPTWSTEYPIPLGARSVKDITVVGPHLLIAVGGGGQPGQVLAMDTDGVFTPLIPEGLGLMTPVRFAPYLSGAVLSFLENPVGLWFRDPLDLEVVNLAAYSFPTIPIGYGDTLATYRDKIYEVARGRSSAPVLQTNYPGEGGWSSHQLAGVSSSGAGFYGMRLRQVSSILALEYIHRISSTWKMGRVWLWDPPIYPGAYSTGSKHFTTSQYQGDVWVTKRFTRIRGHIESTAAVNGVGAPFYVEVYVDGTLVSTGLPEDAGGTWGTTFSLTLPSTALGRSIQLKVWTEINNAANAPIIVNFPWELDYFYVPAEMDIVRIPVVAGAEELRPGGGLTKKSRGDTLQDIQSAVQTGGVWTLDWREGSGLPDWSVVPLSYEVQETADSITPGGGRSVIWLTLQRVA